MSTSREAHRERWREEVEGFKLSGVTLKAYARERNISYGSLRDWNQKLNREQESTRGGVAAPASDAARPRAAFRELRVNASASVTTYEVRLRNGTSLSLGAGFSIERAKQLLEVLRCAE
jgi:hypothetical protein